MELIIDTSAKKMKLIVIEGAITLHGNEFEGNHSEHLLKEIETLISSLDKTVKDISLVSLVVGPGSFTGIRLAVATAKALSCVIDAKFIAIDKLKLIDFALHRKNKMMPNDYLVATYCTGAKSYTLSSSNGEKKSATLLNEDIVRHYSNYTIYSSDLYNDILGDKVEQISLSNNDYIEYVSVKKQNGEYIPPRELQPIYMAVSQAEEELMKRENK